MPVVLWRLAFLGGFSLACTTHVHHLPPPSPVPSLQGRVLSYAHELERASWHLYRNAEAGAYHGGRHGDRILRRLENLHDRARDYRREIERRFWDDPRARRDFESVLRELYRVEEGTRYYAGSRGLYRDLDRVRYVLRRLNGIYGGPYTRYR